MRARRLLVMVLLLGVVALPGMPVAQGSGTADPGGVFVTGHDPDFHARAGNTLGAQRIIQAAIAYVTGGATSPSILVVSALTPPPSGHLSTVQGMQAAGFAGFTVAAAPDQVGLGAVDLNTVDFGGYDVVVVASDFGGMLRQAELDILNSRASALVDFVNAGGGLVAFAESNGGARLTPAGGHFSFLPFLATEVALHQVETSYTVTELGTAMGLTNSDVNGNVSHNVFTEAGGMEVVDVDGAGRVLSLATRQRICPGGVPVASVDDAVAPESAGVLRFTISLDLAPCGEAVTVSYAAAPGTATEGVDYLPVSGTLTFGDGETTKVVEVPVVDDALFEPDEYLFLGLSAPVNTSLGRPQGIGTIANDDSPNGAPDCSAVAPDQAELWPPNHRMAPVMIGGASDPDGDAVRLVITGVSQDEPVRGEGDGATTPDAESGTTADQVLVRAERSGKGDGRVYRIAFTGDDGNGGTCSGTVLVGVRHATPKAPVDSGAVHDSFGP